ncbi:MAG TPA: hypothetical protein VFZ77_18720 [Acidimicrobiales bacterium]
MRPGRWSLATARQAPTVVRAVVATLAGLAVMGAAACGGGGSGGDAATGATRPVPRDDEGATTTVAPLPEDQAIAAYRAAYGAYLAALDPPDPASPDLPRYFGGDALTTIVDTVLSARDQGVRVDASMEMEPVVVSATDSEVVLEDCVVETNTVYDAGTGEPTDSGTYTTHRRATVAVAHDGTWVVQAFVKLEEPCSPPHG